MNYETRSLSAFNAPGVYTVERVAVKDVAGNERSYSTTELQELGFNTQIELSGPKPEPGHVLTRQDAGADIALRVTVEDVFGAPGTRTSDAVAVDPTLDGEVTIRGTDPAGVQVTIQGADGSRIVQADTDGVFRYATTDRTGMTVSAEKPAADADAAITALDALAALRLASGLSMADGTADAFDFIAADVDRNGRVTARDALEILRHSVGVDTEFAPDWVFLDAAADLSQIGPDRTDFEEGRFVQDFAAEPESALQAVLVGDVDATLWSDVPG